MTTTTTTLHSPIISFVQTPNFPAWARMIALCVIGSIFIAVCARIAIPFWPVPVTMQSFAVIMVGMAYGWKMGGATVALYLFEGAIGLPVFAGGAGGFPHLFGPTGGYLFGFLIAAMISGYLAQRGWDKTFLKTCTANVIGTVILFVFGYLWLGYFLMISMGQPLNDAYINAFISGVAPFMIGAVAKIILAALLLPKIGHLIRKK